MSCFWRIELLGGLRMVRPEQTISRFQTYKNGALLAYLAYYHNQPVSREQLIHLFWQNSEMEAARNSLRVALNSLRKQLEPPEISPGTVLVANRMHIQLNSLAIETDVDDFLRAVTKAQNTSDASESIEFYLKAIELYQGELLPGWYEDWIVAERSRLTESYVAALQALVQHFTKIQRFSQAIDYSLRIIKADPLRESAYRNLMRLYVATNRPSHAIQTYHQLEEELRASLNIRPSQGTRELVKKIADSLDGAPLAPASSLGIPAPLSEPAIAPPAPTAPVSSLKGYVPASLRRFFGRETESKYIQECLTDSTANACRILTVTGTGGVGKTRLCQEVGLRLQNHFDGRVWFVSLAELPSPESIEDHLAITLHILPEQGMSLEERIIDTLSTAATLLILDNFERLVDGGAEYVHRLIKHIPSLRVLITSQRRLDISGEQELVLQPLSTNSEGGNFERMCQQDCIRLFVNRAQEARPDFQLTAQNAPTIAHLCQALEGLPLAIELAAAWAQTLTPSQMLERMTERYKWLVNPRKGGNQRHRTLHAAMLWSYDLLSPYLQSLLCQLGVFAGGCTLEAIKSVVHLSESLEPMGLETALRALCQRSLLFIEEDGEHMRFWMLEAVRAFALEQMDEGLPEVEKRYAETYLAYARNWSDDLNTAKSQIALDNLQVEIGNIRVALEWGYSHAPNTFLRVMSRLWRYFYLRSDAAEGCRVLERALLLEPHSDSLAMARLYFGAGRLNAVVGDRRASLRYFTKSLTLFESLQREEQQRYCLMELARGAQEMGDLKKASERYSAVLEHLQRQGDRWNMARISRYLALIAEISGNLKECCAYLEKSIGLCKECGDLWGEIDAIETLIQIHKSTHEVVPSEFLLTESQEKYKSLPLAFGMAGMYLEIASSSADVGDLSVAYQQALMSLEIVRSLTPSVGLPLVLEVAGALALKAQDYAAAYRLLDESLTLAEETQDYPRIQFVEPLYTQARAEAMR